MPGFLVFTRDITVSTQSTRKDQMMLETEGKNKIKISGQGVALILHINTAMQQLNDVRKKKLEYFICTK